MNELSVFDYNDMPVRTLQINSEVWWVLADVCRVLEIKNSHDASKRLDNDEKGVGKTDTLGGNQNVTIVNEAGLYNLIFRSNKPEAKQFKRWVTHEVLPAIRKRGGYNQQDDRLEIAKLIASCKSASAVKAICSLYEIGKPVVECRVPANVNNSVTAFLNEGNTIVNEQAKEVYNEYVAFCKGRKLTPSSLANFSKEIHKQTGCVVKRFRVNGVLVGFYVN